MVSSSFYVFPIYADSVLPINVQVFFFIKNKSHASIYTYLMYFFKRTLFFHFSFVVQNFSSVVVLREWGYGIRSIKKYMLEALAFRSVRDSICTNTKTWFRIQYSGSSRVEIALKHLDLHVVQTMVELPQSKQICS